MSDISKLARLVSGAMRNVDLSQNTLVLSSIKVGGSVSNTELSKAILDNLILLQDGSTEGSSLILDTFDYTNLTEAQDPAGTLKETLQSIDSALGTLQSASGSATDALDSTFRISNSGDNTKKLAFDVSGVEANAVRTLTMPNANVDLGALANSNIAADAAIELSKLDALSTGSMVLVSDEEGVITESSVSAETLSYLDATSSIQDQFDDKIDASEKGANLGVATLDAGGKIPVEQLPSSVMEFQGAWNATTNSPTLIDGTGDAGDIYRVSVAGTIDLGSGDQIFGIGDWVMYNGSIWQHSPASDSVISVNGEQGAVTLDTDDIDEGGTPTNKWFTDSRAKTAAVVNNTAGTETDQAASVAAMKSYVSNATVTAVALVKKTFVAGEAFAADTSFLVRMAMNGETAGRIYKADKDTESADKFWIIGVAYSLAGVSAADSIDVVMLGEHALGGQNSAFNANDIGKPIFLTSAGAFSVTPPDTAGDAVAKIGSVISTSALLVQPQIMGVA